MYGIEYDFEENNLNMREIKEIILHCSATKEGKDFDVEDIRDWHLKRGWSDVGYHYVILLDGTVQEGRPLHRIGSHAKGHNKYSIGICYIGGLDDEMKAKDTRTEEQKKALKELVEELYYKHRDAKVIGHNEISSKACPSFDVQKWMNEEILCNN
jgi:N-acetylmuramoyl-L-alanine amidase